LVISVSNAAMSGSAVSLKLYLISGGRFAALVTAHSALDVTTRRRIVLIRLAKSRARGADRAGELRCVRRPAGIQSRGCSAPRRRATQGSEDFAHFGISLADIFVMATIASLLPPLQVDAAHLVARKTPLL
jgi:hypothetical protein